MSEKTLERLTAIVFVLFFGGLTALLLGNYFYGAQKIKESGVQEYSAQGLVLESYQTDDDPFNQHIIIRTDEDVFIYDLNEYNYYKTSADAGDTCILTMRPYWAIGEGIRYSAEIESCE